MYTFDQGSKEDSGPKGIYGVFPTRDNELFQTQFGTKKRPPVGKTPGLINKDIFRS